MTLPAQPRLTVFLARKAPVAVVLYRRRRLETFCLRMDFPESGGRPDVRLEIGSRFQGLFYPGNCDLSPSGRHFLYCVRTGTRQLAYSRQYQVWTALCVPPRLTSLFLLPHKDTWGGGGCFLADNDALLFNAAHDRPEDYLPMQGKPVDGVNLHFSALTPEPDRTRLRDKALAMTGKALTPAAAMQDATMQDATWADFDIYGRLWLARGGCIEIHNKGKDGLSGASDVHIDIAAAVAAVHPPRQNVKGRPSV